MLKKVPVSDLSHEIGLVSGEPLGLSDDARVQRRPYVERAPYSGHEKMAGQQGCGCMPAV